MKPFERWVAQVDITDCQNCPDFKRPDFQTATGKPDFRCGVTNHHLDSLIEDLTEGEGRTTYIWDKSPFPILQFVPIPEDCPKKKKVQKVTATAGDFGESFSIYDD